MSTDNTKKETATLCINVDAKLYMYISLMSHQRLIDHCNEKIKQLKYKINRCETRYNHFKCKFGYEVYKQCIDLINTNKRLFADTLILMYESQYDNL